MLIHSFCHLPSVLNIISLKWQYFFCIVLKSSLRKICKEMSCSVFSEQLLQDIQWYCMHLLWRFSTLLILQTRYKVAQRASVVFGAVGCCPQPFHRVQEGEGENMSSDNRSTLLLCKSVQFTLRKHVTCLITCLQNWMYLSYWGLIWKKSRQ